MNVITKTDFPGLKYRGKVRDTYQLDNKHLLMIATDRISVFDIVLSEGIPNKGIILAALSEFWFDKTSHIIPNHLVAMANDNKAIGVDYPLIKMLSENHKSRAMIIKEANRIDVECIIRGYITGSAWAEYTKTGTVNGEKVVSGLKQGDKFPEPLFTPTTKAEVGHDENMSKKEVQDLVGIELTAQLEEVSRKIYDYAHTFCLERGIILADTKLEFGLLNNNLILIDEILTPDSSRFWDSSSHVPGEPALDFDKQFVRDYVLSVKWNKEPPAPQLPETIISKTLDRYLKAYNILTGKELIFSKEGK
jgi:phosphoribosylaminoimidazole-succinocarboxamide synthase